MNRDSAFILLGIGGLAFLLYLIFHQLATEYLDIPMAIATFIIVCMLLILGLVLGFFAVSLIILPISVDRCATREAKSAK